MAYGLKAPRRVVTGHDAGGRSVVLSDRPAPRVLEIEGATFYEMWTSEQMPVSLGAELEGEPTDRPVTVPPGPNGTNVRIIDCAPRSRTPMHRTETLDYGIVIAGSCTLELDDGSRTELSSGDVVIQRGTNHAWLVTGDEPARLCFVIIDGRFDESLRARLGERVELFDQALDA
ncbi:MAG TPA: cupin domain-containing protein [Solirubrobacteraceae bacterium]|nr:cupin domain-containing protein [Solirubrobacteraceae bacterium]